MSLRDDIKACYYENMNISADGIARKLGVKQNANFWLTLMKAQGDIKRGVVITHQVYRKKESSPQ